jgi:hypothetical protein
MEKFLFKINDIFLFNINTHKYIYFFYKTRKYSLIKYKIFFSFFLFIIYLIELEKLKKIYQMKICICTIGKQENKSIYIRIY